MARGPLGGDMYRLLLGAARHNEEEMEIPDTCQTCLPLYVPFTVDALLSFFEVVGDFFISWLFCRGILRRFFVGFCGHMSNVSVLFF